MTVLHMGAFNTKMDTRPPSNTGSEKKSSDEALKILPSIHSKITSYYHFPLSPPLRARQQKSEIRHPHPPTDQQKSDFC